MAVTTVLAKCASIAKTAAPNSLFASLRWHLCRNCNQAFGPCLVNVAMSKKSPMPDFPTKSCNLVTFARQASILLLAASLMACATSNNDGLAYTADRGIDNQPYPNQYRSELLAFLKVYLNDPRGVREAAIAATNPKQRWRPAALRGLSAL